LTGLGEGGLTISGKKEHRLNELIRVPEVRLLGEQGEAFGVVSTADAMARAKQLELDLVEISPTATPPVCRIMDYGKFKYQQAKKEADAKKKTLASGLKQLRIKSFRIGAQDIAIKLRKARQFLEQGDRLLVTMMFRAREHHHADLGEKLLADAFIKPLADVSKVEQSPRKDGRRMTMSLAPLPNLKSILALRAKDEEERRKAALAAGIALPEPEVLLLPDDDEDEDDEDFDDEGEAKDESEGGEDRSGEKS
jgi:translation initiation factor IF-3